MSSAEWFRESACLRMKRIATAESKQDAHSSNSDAACAAVASAAALGGLWLLCRCAPTPFVERCRCDLIVDATLPPDEDRAHKWWSMPRGARGVRPHPAVV